jgi:hypothetical protein
LKRWFEAIPGFFNPRSRGSGTERRFLIAI